MTATRYLRTACSVLLVVAVTVGAAGLVVGVGSQYSDDVSVTPVQPEEENATDGGGNDTATDAAGNTTASDGTSNDTAGDAAGNDTQSGHE